MITVVVVVEVVVAVVFVATCARRLDVDIATSSVVRAMRPMIRMEWTLSDGSIKTFSATVEQFHALRYNTAKVLQELGALETHAVMRLAADLERRAVLQQDK